MFIALGALVISLIRETPDADPADAASREAGMPEGGVGA
jgi:hypothetical protein